MKRFECSYPPWASDDKGASAESVELVEKLRSRITANCYACTDELLARLGKIYVADVRFNQNVEKNGEGTAKFLSDAIEIYSREGK